MKPHLQYGALGVDYPSIDDEPLVSVYLHRPDEVRMENLGFKIQYVGIYLWFEQKDEVCGASFSDCPQLKTSVPKESLETVRWFKVGFLPTQNPGSHLWSPTLLWLRERVMGVESVIRASLKE